MLIANTAGQPRRIPYLDAPDFRRPSPGVPLEKNSRIFGRLRRLYGEETARAVIPELVRLVRVHQAHKTDELLAAERAFDPAHRFDERDMMLITYGDMVRVEGLTPLAALAKFLDLLRRRAPVFNTLHILPFFPYTSDRGFSVVDFRTVDPKMGTWADIEALSRTCRLMFDGVFNHASSKSAAFREMLSGNPNYRDFAITFRSRDELTLEQRRLLRRPRTSDVLTRFDSLDGPIWAWTTFSPDQIDLNYRNPKVLLSVIETLLLYVRKGADLVRLDAATYLWIEPGTPSASLAETHEIIKLFRDVLDVAAPAVALVTETNVPHEENITYFGDGSDEAQMVYNFALPPLVLHAFYRQDVSWLTRWAAALDYPSATTTYLNILDTHDGIGLPGVSGILPEEEIAFLIDRARRHGAFVSCRSGPSGEPLPYEINSTWYSALNLETADEPRLLQVRRFVASRSIALALKGVPAIYLHGLAGSRSNIQLALRTHTKRDVNRAVLDEARLERELAQPGSKLYHIHDQLGRLLEMRVRHRAFHPAGHQRVLALSPAVFALLRSSPEDDEHLVALTNVTEAPCRIEIDLGAVGLAETNWYDLVAGRGWSAAGNRLLLRLAPYDVLWLAPFSELERRIESGD